MNPVFRAIAMYFVIAVVLRLAGRRTMGELTTFDFVLLLILSEATQQSLLGQDFSLTTAAIVIATLVATDVFMSVLKRKSKKFEAWTEGRPLILVANGKALLDRLIHSKVEVDEILAAAREAHGIERLDQIKYAVLECHGGISIVPQTP